MITEIINVKDRVEKILEECKEARSSDRELIKQYWYTFEYEKDFSIGQFIDKMPVFESLSRARRMVQKLRPELQAREEIVITRQQEEQYVRDFFIGNGC